MLIDGKQYCNSEYIEIFPASKDRNKVYMQSEDASSVTEEPGETVSFSGFYNGRAITEHNLSRLINAITDENVHIFVANYDGITLDLIVEGRLIHFTNVENGIFNLFTGSNTLDIYCKVIFDHEVGEDQQATVYPFLSGHDIRPNSLNPAQRSDFKFDGVEFSASPYTSTDPDFVHTILLFHRNSTTDVWEVPIQSKYRLNTTSIRNINGGTC